MDFELNLSYNLTRLYYLLKKKTYRLEGYYEFRIHDPKERDIHALHYVDRVVLHCLCDEYLSQVIESKLVYDNAACRNDKGTHFALKRLKRFLVEYLSKNGNVGYFLKCDIAKYFDSIDHDILKNKLKKSHRRHGSSQTAIYDNRQL